MYNKELFSERLKELRRSTGETQKDFANSVGCSTATLSAYENGTKNPSLEIVSNITQKYKVSLDWLCGLENGEKLNIKTYKDIYCFLLTLQKEHGDLILLETVESPFSEKLPAIAFDNIDISSFFDDWKKMNSLLAKDAIDREVYDLWVEKTLKKADTPIENNTIIDRPF
mgnify:CR=1 FL=1